MMSRIDRIRRAVSARSASQTESDKAEEAFEVTSPGLPAPVGPVTQHRSFRDERRDIDSEFAAQLIGQDGERRGLRAGPSLIDRARLAYNRIEWSGSFDRRARKGRQAETEI